MRIERYDRPRALEYAQTWAFARNPKFMDFSKLGGDCTNFVSQCLYAGSRTMNFTPNTGWYYIAPGKYAPAWSGVRFLHRFLTTNEGAGPFGEAVSAGLVQPADVVFLSDGRRYYHSLLVTDIRAGEILVAAHTFDAFDRPLSTYTYDSARMIHILGVRRV